jgi:hypothetical protein
MTSQNARLVKRKENGLLLPMKRGRVPPVKPVPRHTRGRSAHCGSNLLCGGFLSVQAISWVIDNSKQNLGPFIVLLMIANHARSDGTGAWPSVATIARESRLSERQTRYCLRKLEQSGELQTQIKAGPHGTNTYSLPLMVGAKSAPLGAVSAVPRGNLRPNEGHPIAPEPSLTVKDKEELYRLIEDYNNGKTHTDDDGRKYKISPTSRERIYV